MLRSTESHNLQAVFRLRSWYTKGRSVSQAFLAETVETGNKNRDDFHCMQMRLMMSMWLIFGDDWGDARSWSRSGFLAMM